MTRALTVRKPFGRAVVEMLVMLGSYADLRFDV